MPIRAVIFDLDGTLLDTMGDIHASLNTALQEEGLRSVSIDDCRRRVGRGLEVLVRRSLPESVREDNLIQRVARRFSQAYHGAPARFTVPFPGVDALLETLRNAAIKTAVLSNKPDDLARLVVERVLPDHEFVRVLGGRADMPHKPDPASTLMILEELQVSPADTLFVGDSEVDIGTARNARCVSAGVAWGYSAVDSLVEAGADHICYSTGEVLNLISVT